MARVFRLVLVIASLGIVTGAVMFRSRPQAQEPNERDADQVTASELDLYIDVYTRMQGDHDLTLESVLTEKGVPLAQFRNIERRVQKQDRLVRKVREALQAQAKTRADALTAPQARAEAPPGSAPSQPK